MKFRLRIDIIFDFYEIWKFFDHRPSAALTTLRPNVTVERLTDGYQE